MSRLLHDDVCEIGRFKWDRCSCAERAYAASCDPAELAEFMRNTGWGKERA